MGKTLKRQRQRARAAEAAQPPKRVKYTDKGLAAAVSDALAARRWEAAVAALRQYPLAGKAPKLGAIMRWVRQADQAGDEQLAAGLLDAIMRAAAPAAPAGAGAGASAATAATATPSHDASVAAAAAASSAGSVQRHAAWEAVPLGHACEDGGGDGGAQQPAAAPKPSDYASAFVEVPYEGHGRGGPHAIYTFPEGASAARTCRLMACLLPCVLGHAWRGGVRCGGCAGNTVMSRPNAEPPSPPPPRAHACALGTLEPSDPPSRPCPARRHHPL